MQQGNMALESKQEIEIEIKSAAEHFYDVLKSKIQHLPNISSDNIHTIEVHEGDWESSGSVKLWKVTVGGQTETVKEKVDIDEANKSISFTALEGDLFKHYKSPKAIVKVNPKAEGGSVKITIEYEKINEEVPEPQKYLDFFVNDMKDIDAYLLNPS